MRTPGRPPASPRLSLDFFFRAPVRLYQSEGAETVARLYCSVAGSTSKTRIKLMVRGSDISRSGHQIHALSRSVHRETRSKDIMRESCSLFFSFDLLRLTRRYKPCVVEEACIALFSLGERRVNEARRQSFQSSVRLLTVPNAAEGRGRAVQREHF